MPRAGLLALLCLSVLVAGCGGGSASGGGEPASAVPRDAAFYLEATVRPEGSLHDDALAAAGKVLRTDDPQAKIDELLAKAFAESEQPKLDYERDVKPWLGEKVALWAATTSGEEDFRGAVVASATDADAAQAAIDRAVEGSEKTFRARSYEGVDYRASDTGAAGVVEDFAVFGTEAEFKRTVDAIEGDGLGDDDRFREATDALEAERLGTFYVDVKAIIAQAVREDPEFAARFEQAERLFPLDRVGPVAGAFMADGERLAVDAGADVPEDAAAGRLGALTGGATPLLGELPADAWVAFGSPRLGETAELIYQQAAGAIGGAAIEGHLRSELGLDLQEDVFSWIGDVAFFARGTSEDALEGGALIEVIDPAKAEPAFGKLIGLAQSRGGVDARPVRVEGADTAFELAAPGASKTVIAARTDERVVIAYGMEAAVDALGSGDRLADSDTYAEARSVLGDELEPGLLVSMPAVVELLAGQAGDDPDFARAKPYLEAFGVIASGSQNEDGRARTRAAAALR